METSPVRLGSEWAGPPTHRAAVGVLGSTATVSVTSTRACRVSERLDEVHEDREQRGISLGLMIPGGILAAVGVSMLADPGPSCADHPVLRPARADRSRLARARWHFLRAGASQSLSAAHEHGLPPQRQPLKTMVS